MNSLRLDMCSSYPTYIYLLKVNNKKVSLLLTLDIFHTLFCFYKPAGYDLRYFQHSLGSIWACLIWTNKLNLNFIIFGESHSIPEIWKIHLLLLEILPIKDPAIWLAKKIRKVKESIEFVRLGLKCFWV